MSLESFIGLDSGEGMSESALENLRERMKAAAAQIAALKKEEKKHKKKEDELLSILFKFVKTSQKTDLVLLVSRALEKNIPANFILAVILLGNEDIQKELGDFIILSAGEQPDGADLPEATASDRALIFFSQHDETLPLKVKIKMDTWIKGLLYQAGERPQKILRTAYPENNIDESLIKLLAFVIRDYLGQNGLEEAYEKIANFSKFILKGILTKTQENLDNRKFIGE